MARRADGEGRGGQAGERRTPAGERRRAELMQAAVLLAADRGLQHTRVSDIVGHVGVGQGVFYWYFHSKDELVQEILDDTTLRLRRFQAAAIAGEPDPLRRIAKGIVASFDFIVRNAHVFAVLDHERARIRNRREAGRIHVLDTARHIEEAIERGLARPCDAAAAARAVGGVVSTLSWELFATRRADPDSLVQEAVDFCIGGLTGSRTLSVAELRADMHLGPELEEIRDRVGAAAADGARRGPRNSC